MKKSPIGIVAVIAAILAVAGGAWWYTSSQQAARTSAFPSKPMHVLTPQDQENMVAKDVGAERAYLAKQAQREKREREAAAATAAKGAAPASQ